VFIKPQANTPKVEELVKTKFSSVGITILKEGEITGPVIDAKQYIDNHYYAIASKATIMAAKDLNIPVEKFAATFGEEWATVCAEGRALNALEIKNKFGWTADELDAKWNETSDKHDPKTRIKFGGGFYCGKLVVEGTTYYTFNAFFMTMRDKFTGADAKIHYFVVEFDSETLAWADFRGKVLGPTNPADAPSDSLRGMVLATWQELGLQSAPDTGDNAVHASASPFEGLAERTNWLGDEYTIGEGDKQDSFAKALIAEGLDVDTIKAWTVDPQVLLVKGEDKKGSVFDQLEDKDSAECIAKLKELYGAKSA